MPPILPIAQGKIFPECQESKNIPNPMKIPLTLLLSMAVSHADKLQLAEMEKLSEPERRDAEVSRLANDGASSPIKCYHFLKAAQSAGKPPLHVLAAERDYSGAYVSPYEYAIEKPNELFATGQSDISTRTEPTLEPICDSLLMIFDQNGKETRPFGGNNYISFGYLFDFDGDGILDRADSTNYGLENAEKHSVQVFKLESVEPKPQTLLRVIFNFHPRSADGANTWAFQCYDENSDGIPEIAFGQQAGENSLIRREIVFRFDKATGSYSAGKLPEKSHVRVISADDDLETIAKAGGLGYPLLEKGGNPLPSSRAKDPYVFQSLKNLPIADLAAFFQGKNRRDIFSGAEGSFPNRLPENLLSLAPKGAAMAIAEANRTPNHRAGYQLAIDDRHGIAPPASGWILYDWSSSGCYSSSSASYAIRFGVPEPVLLYFGDNHIGVVGRNRWADQPAHNARLVRLSEKEARFLAETLFWLDRIRSRVMLGNSDEISSSSSTADGFASVSLFPDDAAPRLLASDTAWATSSISGKWEADYEPETFVNLAGLLVDDGIPQILGDRWEKREITPHSLSTSTEQRLEPRVNDSERKRLAGLFAEILEMNSLQPIPADILRPLCSAAGAEALVSLLPSLEKLHASLPAPDEEEKEYEILRRRFARNHFGAPLADDPDDHMKDYERMETLEEKLRHQPAHVLRDPLESAITRLRLAADPDRLNQAIIDESPEKSWALNLLRRNDPAAWASFVSADYQKTPQEERSDILTTLAAGHPPAAAEIIRNLSPGERVGQILEIARFHHTHEPGSLAADIPEILKIVRDRDVDYYRRDAAMRFLSEIQLSPEQLQEFRSLLVTEIKKPVKSKESWMGDTCSCAVEALANLPAPSQHLSLLMKTPGIGKKAFGSGFKALSLMSENHPDRERILADFMRPQFTDSQGFMNGIFIKALSMDLRRLAPEIAAFASASPDAEDGDGADYSGGQFKSPVGHRYHIAREITALWSEKDPATLAKMWIAFACARPDHFEDEDATPLRNIAEKHIMTLPAPERKHALDEISRHIPVPEYHSATMAWLTSLAD